MQFELEDIKRIKVEPGETLLVKIDARGLTKEVMHETASGIRALLPTGVNVILTDLSTEMSVIEGTVVI